MTREPLAVGEWYHCFNRGVDKRRVFTSTTDYERFLTLLYICNGTRNVRLSERYDTTLEGVLADPKLDRGEPLVELGIYALLPNHVHLLCKEIHKGGIARFMQKIFTGYTMYFNLKNDRTGTLFAGTFKSRHVNDDRYFKQAAAYLLLNPAELFEPGWKNKRDVKSLESQIVRYPFSSLPDFLGVKRPHNSIVSDLTEYFDKKPTLKELLRTAASFEMS